MSKKNPIQRKPYEPDKSEYQIAVDSRNYFVVSPKTINAAIFFGKGTNWSISTPDLKYNTLYDGFMLFEKYYIVIRKHDARKWLVIAFSDGATETYDEHFTSIDDYLMIIKAVNQDIDADKRK